ncbi:MAG: hypothetical protein AAF368_03910, partial [Planctomycetota bacterium]
MPIDSISLPLLAQVYNGEIVNWNELGGPDLPILLSGYDEKFGTQEVFRRRVMKRVTKGDPLEIKTYENSFDLCEFVSRNAGA